MNRLKRVYEMWRSGFVSTRGALGLLGLPELYTRAEVEDAMAKAVLCSERLRAREENCRIGEGEILSSPAQAK